MPYPFRISSTKHVSYLFLFLIGLLLSGCGEIQSYPNQDFINAGVAAPTVTTFSVLNQNIIQPLCIACHSGPTASQGIDLSSYSAMMASGVVIAGNSTGSLIYQMVATGLMPQGGPTLSTAQRNEIVNEIGSWIDAGATND